MPLQRLSKVTFWSCSRTIALGALFGTSLSYALWKWLAHVESECKTRRKRNIPPGLVNTGNTCFMNALLQSFSSTTPFVTWLQQFSSRVTDDTERQYLANTMLQIIQVLNGELESPSYYDASNLLQAMAGRGWQISSEEQDTHEFFYAVITTLSDEYYHLRSSSEIMDLSVTKDLVYLPLKQPGSCMGFFRENWKYRDGCPFRGSLASILHCETCGHYNPTKCDGFDSLSIPLGQTTSYRLTLMECLEKFMSSEVLNNVDCERCISAKDAEASHAGYINSSTTTLGYATSSSNIVHQGEDEICNEWNSLLRQNYTIRDARSTFQYRHVKGAEEKCHYPKVSIKRSFRRSLCLAKLPECLCIHLQRLVWIDGNPVKVMNFVLFPEILDVTSLTYSNRLLQNRSSGEMRHANVDIMGASSASASNQERLCASTLPKQTHCTKRQLYRLASVIVHVGDWSCSGHFYAYRKGIAKDGQSEWVFTSDTLARRATHDEVFSCPAYMLIYERVHSKLDCLGRS